MYVGLEMVKIWNKHGAFVCTGYNMKKQRAYRMHSNFLGLQIILVTVVRRGSCVVVWEYGTISLYKQMHPDSQLSWKAWTYITFDKCLAFGTL